MTAKSGKPRSRMETIAWIALIVFIGYRIWPQGAAAVGVASANAPAPAIQLRTMAGTPISSDSLRGEVVLVNFWATWCPPCRYEMPGFQAVYDRHHTEGFTVLG
ncbi:MAG: TlpA family protein disulfide reductase, partial [Gemmatimonadota bacterium]|nr:TlpA family protein disulfide reductase [Gemmatimonadota bacterium]